MNDQQKIIVFFAALGAYIAYLQQENRALKTEVQSYKIATALIAATREYKQPSLWERLKNYWGIK